MVVDQWWLLWEDMVYRGVIIILIDAGSRDYAVIV